MAMYRVAVSSTTALEGPQEVERKEVLSSLLKEALYMDSDVTQDSQGTH